MRALCRTVLLSALLASSAPVLAVQPDEMLKDPQLEERAREISAGLRCLVCQNQSIDDSDAPLAKDLRVLVRERLQTGDSDAKVLEFLVNRYGDFILLRPQFNVRTYALWGAPLLILMLGIVLARRTVMANRTQHLPQPVELSAQEKAKLQGLLDGDSVQPKA
jgi:cytochrome c-type biogenesis protein CcmH